MTELHRFLNALRILNSIDHYEVVAVHVTGAISDADWSRFRKNPFLWLMKASDEDAARIWTIIERRQPKAAA